MSDDRLPVLLLLGSPHLRLWCFVFPLLILLTDNISRHVRPSLPLLQSPLPVVLLSGPPMGDTMLRAVALQDKSLAFQTFISKLSSQAAPLSVVASSTAKRRFDVVMLVHEGPLGGTPKTNEAAFKLLVQLLKAGEDTIHLVYFAQDAGELGRAKTVLEGFQPDDNPMLKVERKVQVITESIPIALDHFADGVGAQLVVVAASAATGGGAVLGSVAMTVAKKCTFPLLVAKPDLEGRVAAAGARLRAVQDEEVGARRDAVLRGASRDAPGLRVMLGVEARGSPALCPRTFSHGTDQDRAAMAREVARPSLTSSYPLHKRRLEQSHWNALPSCPPSSAPTATRSFSGAARATRALSSRPPPGTTPRCASSAPWSSSPSGARRN